MSEYVEHVTMCDKCYPDFFPGFPFFRLEAVKGIFRGAFDLAQTEGWQECDYGHLCPDCVAEEAQEDGEVLTGQAAIDSLGVQNEPDMEQADS